MRPFVLVAQARTGGHLVVELLNSHPMIHCDNEPFLPRWRENPLRVQRLIRKAFAYRCVERRSKLRSDRMYGFKLLINQIFFLKRTFSAMHKKGWRIIHLRRRNIVRQTASLLIARKTHEWHRETEESAYPSKVSLDGPEFLKQLAWQESVASREKALLKMYPHLTINYEDGLGRLRTCQETLDRLFQYLSLPRCEVTSKFLRIHPGPLREYIENYEEIVQVLGETKYGNLLDG